VTGTSLGICLALKTERVFYHFDNRLSSWLVLARSSLNVGEITEL